MLRTIRKTCDCCGAEFWAGNSVARWCGNRCSMRAYQRRRRGEPEADHQRPARQHVVQPQLVDAPSPRAALPAAIGADIESRSWQGTPIQRRQRDGWVNATAMCQAGGKRWNHYAANDRTKEYITALQDALVAQNPCGPAVAGNPATGSTQNPATLPPVIETRQGGAAHLQGTWVHPRLAVDLARWISPAFAVWMDGWFLEAIGRTIPHHQPTTPGISITARSEREAMELWQAAIEAETTRALRLTLGTTGRTDAGLRPSGQWRFVPC
jgi:hypothetical protein